MTTEGHDKDALPPGTQAMGGRFQEGAWSALTVALLLVGAEIGPVKPGSGAAKALRKLVDLHALAGQGAAVPVGAKEGLALARKALRNLRATRAPSRRAEANQNAVIAVFEGMEDSALDALFRLDEGEAPAAGKAEPQVSSVVDLAAERRRRAG